MGRLAQTEGLTDIQQEILAAVHDFVEKEIIPNAQELEHADEYPADIVEGMKEMGIFGLMIPEEYGGLGESLLTYALCVEEIARGWMSVCGIINTHFIVAYMLMQHGTDEQKADFLPRMATGEIRGAFSMSEPHCGRDVAAITVQGRARRRRLRAQRPEDVADQRRHLDAGGGAGAHRRRGRRGRQRLQEDDDLPRSRSPPGFGEVLPGLTIPGKIDKMGYKGVDTTELVMDGLRIPADRAPRRRARQGLLPDDGRRRGRPRQRRRPCVRLSRCAPSSSASTTPSSATPSASRSPSTRPCSSASPTWRSRSRPRTR